jgi:hypothetical protein
LRFPPKVRLAGLDFLVAKPGTFREILRDLVEAGNICATGCDLYGLDDASRSFVLAYPINPNPGHIQEATAAAYGYKRDFKTIHTYTWGIKLNFKRRNSFLRINDRVDRDWVTSNIENVQIRPVSLDYELHSWTDQGKPQLLGMWRP